MARGGYRRPSGGPRHAGVGKDSNRTDANQPVSVPNVGESDLEYGDRQKYEEAQQSVPLAKTPPPPRVQPRPIPRGGGGGRLPSFIRDLPSGRPDEPGTAGLPSGPGAGPEALSTPPEPTDEREAVLLYLASRYNNPDAKRLLQEYRTGGVNPGQGTPLGTPAPATEQEGLPSDVDSMFGEA